MDVSAVLVTYNSGPVLRDALQSLADDLAGYAWEAVVVDNASSDTDRVVAGAFAPRVRVLANRENVGFARGVNQGIAASTAPLVLIMNPDCRLIAGAFAQMTRELAQARTAAIVAPRILNADGTVQGNARGDPDMLTGIFGRAAFLRRLLPGLTVSRRNVVDDADGTARTVDWVSGACMLARRDALADVGGFDERYFLYWEDADLCRRLRSRGYIVRYAPFATAVHQGGHSSRGAKVPAVRAFHESAYLYYATHVAPASPARRAVARVLLMARCGIHTRLG